MSKRTLSIFVDESGILTESAARSRFYILTLLCHDQSFPIKPHADALDSDMTTIGIANLCFHASPVIHAVCTLKLLETKLDLNLPLSNSEIRFFGGPRMFKRNVLKYLKRKEI